MKVFYKIDSKSKLILLCICLFVSDCIFSQSSNPILENIIPPSPNAAALSKYGDLPISYAFGTPQISIPIYSYTGHSDGLSLPISLDYHSGGVRVDEIASDVGIGWSLNFGGAITRTVKGRPDETPDYGFMYSHTLPATTEVNNSDPVSASLLSIYNTPYQSADPQADLFTFTCGSENGQFIYGKNNDFLMLTNQNIKIEKTIGTLWGNTYDPMIIGFTLTTEDGTKYIYQDAEVSFDGYYHKFCNSWYLTKIVSAKSSNTIDFTYGNYEIPLYNLGVLSHGEIVSHGGSGGPSERPGRYLTNFGQTQINVAKRITTITFPNQVHIDFSYDALERADFPGMHSLKKIQVANGSDYTGFNLKQDYHLNRLTLNEIIPYDRSDIESKGYQCSYYGSSLPDRLSYAQDHWGFYNGADDNGGPMPDEYIYSDGYNAVYDLPQGVYAHLTGADREVNTDKAKYASLTQLKYPTGGFTNFTWESNQAFDPRLDKVITTSDNLHEQVNIVIQLNNNQPTKINNYTFKGDQNTNTLFEVSFPHNYSTTTGYVEQVVKNHSGTVVGGSGPIPTSSTQPITSYPYHILNMINGELYTISTTLTNTNFAGYTAQLVISEDHSQSAHTTTLHILHPYVGGLRIKSIEDYDGIQSNPATSRNFEYLIGDQSHSSGELAVYPVYTTDFTAEFIEDLHNGLIDPATIHDGGNGGVHSSYLFRYSYPMQTLVSVLGQPVIYNRVVEYFQNKGLSNGKEVRYYTTFWNYAYYPQQGFNNYQNGGMIPYTPAPYHDWAYGKLLIDSVYDNSNVAIKETINEYQVGLNSVNTENFRSISIMPTKWQTGQNPNYTWEDMDTRALHFMMNNFYPVTGRTNLIKSTVYENSGNQVLKSETSFTYSPLNYLIKTKTSVNSRGENIITHYNYPLDYIILGSPSNNIPLGIQTLQSKHIVNPVIEQYTQKSNFDGSNLRTIGGVFTSYKPYIPVPDTILDLEIAAPVTAFTPATITASSFNRNLNYQAYVQFDSYDANYNLIKQHKTGDISHSYIWGYNNSLAIAEVVNASSNEIYFNSFEEGVKNDNIYWDGTMDYNNQHVHSGKTAGFIHNVNSTELVSFAKQKLTINLTAPKKYHFSGWIYSTASAGADIYLFMQGSTQYPFARTIEINKWVYISGEYLVPASTSQIWLRVDNNGGGDVWFDDLRLYPSDAQMTTYTYDPLTGMTSQSDANNLLTTYEYDKLGRLSLIRDQDGYIRKKYEYAYQSANPDGGAACSSQTNCVGDDEKCVNGFCEKATRHNMSTTLIKTGANAGKWRCTFYYEWTDKKDRPDVFGTNTNPPGTPASPYTEFNAFPCDIDP